MQVLSDIPCIAHISSNIKKRSSVCRQVAAEIQPQRSPQRTSAWFEQASQDSRHTNRVLCMRLQSPPKPGFAPSGRETA